MSPPMKAISCADAGMSSKCTELDCISLKSMTLCSISQKTITAAVKKCSFAKQDIRVCSRKDQSYFAKENVEYISGLYTLITI